MRSKDIRGRSRKRLKHGLGELKELFALNRTERRALRVILLVLIGLVVTRYVQSRDPDRNPLQITSLDYQALADLRQETRTRQSARPRKRRDVYAGQELSLSPVPFDPNEADSATLSDLGLPAYVVRNILAYRKAGGGFRKPSDLGRIFGMREDWARELEPYVTIAANERAGPAHSVELNAADSALLVQLPGIGPVYARRIIRYRDALGGFRQPDQLLQVYGMDTARYLGFLHMIDIDTVAIERIPVNEAEFHRLRKHPLIGYELAYEIIEYRKLYGDLGGLEELETTRDLDPGQVALLRAYLSFE